MSIIDNLEGILAKGRDNALLRFSLGSEYMKAGDAAKAAEHLRAAVEHDPAYSAAWKVLGRALAAAGRGREAEDAFEKGIAAAEARRDKQAAKEMGVFLKRLRKNREG
jgi:Tfp pilus assembly protein PilF